MNTDNDLCKVISMLFRYYKFNPKGEVTGDPTAWIVFPKFYNKHYDSFAFC